MCSPVHCSPIQLGLPSAWLHLRTYVQTPARKSLVLCRLFARFTPSPAPAFGRRRRGKGPANAPWFDRWLPRSAAAGELGERGMMSLTGWERLRRTPRARRATGNGYLSRNTAMNGQQKDDLSVNLPNFLKGALYQIVFPEFLHLTITQTLRHSLPLW